MGPPRHLLIAQPADDLAVFEDERHLPRAYLEHRARSLPAGTGIAEAGIEKTRIMDAKFADQRIERHHLGGVIGGHLYRFFRRKDVEFAGIEDQRAVRP